MSSQHADAALTVRPPADVKGAAQEALAVRDREMRAFVVACLTALAADPDRLLDLLGPYWPARKRRGRPRGTRVDTVRVARPSGQHQARPGRAVLVVADLADLRGPAHGTVQLPLRLFWSPPGRVFDLDDPDMLRSMYEIVLGEAIRGDELGAFLNGDRLAAVWPDLYLPKGVRRAWEERHPVLLAAKAA